MSPSAYIVRRVKVGGAWVSSRTARPTNRDDRRYVVRYRLGPGRALHAGTFRTENAAEARRRWVELQIAEGRGHEIPALLEAPVAGATLAETLDETLAALPSPSVAQRKRFRQARAALGPLGERPIEDVTRRALQTWINELSEKYAPATVGQYLVPVRQAFDHAEITPNPARDRRLKLPLSDEGEEFTPPTWAEFEAMVGKAPWRYRDLLVVLEGTGLRIAEALALEWGDVDFAGDRLRVARGRTKGRTGGRRFVPLTPRVAAAIRRQSETPGDYVGVGPALSGPVFRGITDQGARQAMRRACAEAGIAHFHPHDLRGRWISLNLIAGVPVELVARMAGHRRTSMTLDVYSHVVLQEPAERLEELRSGVRVVFGLSIGDSVPTIPPANEGGDRRMEDTGIDSSRV